MVTVFDLYDIKFEKEEGENIYFKIKHKIPSFNEYELIINKIGTYEITRHNYKGDAIDILTNSFQGLNDILLEMERKNLINPLLDYFNNEELKGKAGFVFEGKDVREQEEIFDFIINEIKDKSTATKSFYIPWIDFLGRKLREKASLAVLEEVKSYHDDAAIKDKKTLLHIAAFLNLEGEISNEDIDDFCDILLEFGKLGGVKTLKTEEIYSLENVRDESLVFLKENIIRGDYKMARGYLKLFIYTSDLVSFWEDPSSRISYDKDYIIGYNEFTTNFELKNEVDEAVSNFLKE